MLVLTYTLFAKESCIGTTFWPLSIGLYQNLGHVISSIILDTVDKYRILLAHVLRGCLTPLSHTILRQEVRLTRIFFIATLSPTCLQIVLCMCNLLLVVGELPNLNHRFVILDCCHSGSALELPFVYRSDDDGNVNMIDNVKQGVCRQIILHTVMSNIGHQGLHLAAEAGDLLYGGFSFNKVAEAQDLLAGATSFFRSFQHRHDNGGPPGLASDQYSNEYSQEHKCKQREEPTTVRTHTNHH